MAKPKEKKEQAQEKLLRKKALELYKKTINFNVISRYDPSVKKLLYHTSYSVIYKFDASSEQWIKTDFQGSLSLYLRGFQIPQHNFYPTYQDLQNLFCYGLILLNRSNPQCFSIGLLPNNVTKHYFPRGVNNSGIVDMNVELADNLIIIKNLFGEIYGLWVFNEDDRNKLFRLLEFCLTSDSSKL